METVLPGKGGGLVTIYHTPIFSSHFSNVRLLFPWAFAYPASLAWIPSHPGLHHLDHFLSSSRLSSGTTAFGETSLACALSSVHPAFLPSSRIALITRHPAHPWVLKLASQSPYFSCLPLESRTVLGTSRHSKPCAEAWRLPQHPVACCHFSAVCGMYYQSLTCITYWKLPDGSHALCYAPLHPASGT